MSKLTSEFDLFLQNETVTVTLPTIKHGMELQMILTQHTLLKKAVGEFLKAHASGKIKEQNILDLKTALKIKD